MKLYEIANQYRDALDNIEVDENGELLNADQIEAVDGAFDDKAEAVAVYIKELSCFSSALKDEKKRIEARIKATESKVEWLKGYLTRQMEVAQKEELKGLKASISFRQSISTRIDECQLPKKYWRVTTKREPDKDALKKLLKDGVKIRGAELVVNRNIQIK